MHPPLPLTRDVVLIGGGHSHALVLRRWAMRPLAGVRLTLINPGPGAAYSGMLPGHIAGHYPREALEIDLVRLARFADARLVLARATGIDRAARRVQIEGQADIFYDLASVDVGITTDLPMIAGFAEHALGAKPLDAYVARWERFLANVAAGRQKPQAVLIGGGVAGVELSLAMMFRLKREGAQDARITVLEAAPTPMAGLGAGARKALASHAAHLGVRIRCGVQVTRVSPEAVHLADGSRIASAFTLGTGAARPHGWLADTGLTNAQGFIDVGPTLQSLADDRIFAAGDCAELTHAPRPKAGVFAVRQAPVLYENLRALARGTPLRRYDPQKDFLKLISTGGKRAIADKAGLRLDHKLLWRWKDRIDRKFMRKFADYPQMPGPDLPAQAAQGVRETLGKAPLCGGCGAKLASTGLAPALARLPPPARADVLSLPGDDAAILACGAHRQVLTTDHLRAFMGDPFRMARIAAIHALGDIWAMGAAPQAALASIVLPRMRPEMQRETLREIMQAASDTFRENGAEVVGGHTSQGAEMSIGFSVTGLAKGTTVANAGARPGDALILTKPLGSGTILAAEMRRQAKGRWVAAAYRGMERPQARAAAILSPHARAMTDVTGFGLAGHLATLLAGAGAALHLDAVPLLAGAEALARAGIRSTIWQANRDAVAQADVGDSPRARLLFDPQTAGGLLAALPPARAETCVEALRAAGETAALIGYVNDSGRITAR